MPRFSFYVSGFCTAIALVQADKGEWIHFYGLLALAALNWWMGNAAREAQS